MKRRKTSSKPIQQRSKLSQRNDNDDEAFFAMAVVNRHPDDPGVEYVPAGFEQEGFLNHYSLEHFKTRIEQGDPTAIVEAFIEARHAHCYPNWLLAMMGEAFLAYYDKKKVGLDDALGLSPGKWTNSAVRSRQRSFAYELYLLQSGLGISLGKAAEMVQIKYRGHPVPHSAAGRTRSFDYTVESFTKVYRSKWKKQFNLLNEKPLPPIYRGGRFDSRAPGELHADWRTFLMTFPPEARALIPEKIRSAFLEV